MGIADVVWMSLILGGAGYLLYRSVWKKKGHCQGCDNISCSKKLLITATALLGCLLTPMASVRAAEPVGPPDNVLPTAKNEAEIYHTPAEKLVAGLYSRFTKQVTFSGLLELEASFADSGSELTLAMAQLGLGVKIDKNLSGTLVLLVEDGRDPKVDEATIDLAGCRWSARVGHQLLPFGRFYSHFVTDPLTLKLGETKETALLGRLTAKPFSLSAFVFSGDAREDGEKERIEDWGAALTITPTEAVKFGVSYLSDLAETAAGLFADVGDLYHQQVAGWSAFAVATLGPVDLSAEMLGAVESSAAADGGGRPEAWNLEVAYDLSTNVEVALRYEWSHELPSSVQRRYGAAVSWSPWEQVSLTAEFLRAETGDTGDKENVVTARIALEF